MADKFYILVAEASDPYYGEPIVDYVLYTEKQKNRIEEDYKKWFDDHAEKINDYGNICTGEGKYVDAFMYYLDEIEDMPIYFWAWETVYFKEMKFNV